MQFLSLREQGIVHLEAALFRTGCVEKSYDSRVRAGRRFKSKEVLGAGIRSIAEEKGH